MSEEPMSKEEFLAQNKFTAGDGNNVDNTERTEAMGIIKSVR